MESVSKRYRAAWDRKEAALKRLMHGPYEGDNVGPSREEETEFADAWNALMTVEEAEAGCIAAERNSRRYRLVQSPRLR